MKAYTHVIRVFTRVTNIHIFIDALDVNVTQELYFVHEINPMHLLPAGEILKHHDRRDIHGLDVGVRNVALASQHPGRHLCHQLGQTASSMPFLRPEDGQAAVERGRDPCDGCLLLRAEGEAGRVDDCLGLDARVLVHASRGGAPDEVQHLFEVLILVELARVQHVSDSFSAEAIHAEPGITSVRSGKIFLGVSQCAIYHKGIIVQ